MSEFALLTIQKKLDHEKHPLYWNLYMAKKSKQSIDKVLQNEGIDSNLFGKIRFIENHQGIFVEHVSHDPEKAREQQLKCEMDVPSEWLMCFSYQDMKVIGLDMGVFEAEANMSDVFERLHWSEIENSNFDLFVKRDLLIKWLRKHSTRNDRIHLSSDWLFYHPEGKYDYEFVQRFINRRISELRKTVTCNHWSKDPLARLQPIQMTAS
ncbi:hypothetical protein [Paenibacillus polymyxa]|uniref:Uncharacterized protein n=1 Tax=Paenibacillus polymyxa (strain SC2) TaxID=886882 RepID=E3EJR8_PAEPS|nr:hypothetical protein [Paenibacillus polymyxa]ADO59666.1 hypothetical protein PPSC2_26785 [Paenibacillus polymyxa SC2]WPQ59507.1 hypothetical protein SKN87_27995 [Paenibacillus polymyxa]